jgi:transglutaminase-like putative cysteine protease
MQFTIAHTTTYRYSQPVVLEPHVLRLCPRGDATQRREILDIAVVPIPQQSPLTDLDGNALVKLWFVPEPSASLVITVRSHVETLGSNPFNYLLEPWAQRLEIDYPASLLSQLQPYLCPPCGGFDAGVMIMAQAISRSVDGNVSQFLTALNQRIHDACTYVIRDTGDPFPAGYTWLHRSGSCRDLTVLFMDACRSVGLAARFVSGYQCLPDVPPDHVFQLHAWAEVYLPGAGWRGFDPTQAAGAVGDRYISLVASAHSRYTAPVLGKYTGNAQAQMDYKLTIQPH